MKYLLLLLLAAPAFSQTITFTPNQTVADGRLIPVLTWASSPAGATSCTASGGWTGTKTGSGTETLPEITSSKTYTLTCAWPTTSGTATVSWTAPSLNTDGTPLTDLAGFRVYYGTSQSLLGTSDDAPGATTRQRLIDNLAAGTWYFAVRAVNVNGAESANSNIAAKLVGATAQTVSVSTTITIRPVPAAPILTTVVVAGVDYVPIIRVTSAGNAISSTFYGLVPTGRLCGKRVATWRGKAIHYVQATWAETWGLTNIDDLKRLAAPCA